MHNPMGGPGFATFEISRICPEAKEYLQKSHALQATPMERLVCLNPRSIDLYRDHGIDLAHERLEIAVCAQHNNGGLRANHWWESNIRHLFPVGEVNGTHGVYRPGGAALNAGQVGGLRAAMFIAAQYQPAAPDVASFASCIECQLAGILERITRWFKAGDHPGGKKHSEFALEIRRRMSRHGAHIRNPRDIPSVIEDARRVMKEAEAHLYVDQRWEIPAAFKTLELALTHVFYLEAIGEYINKGGQSRGSYLIPTPDGDQSCAGIGDNWRFTITEEEAFVNRHVLELAIDSEYRIHKTWVPVRPIPAVDDWFENVWRDYLNSKVFE
jgi:hypothetical protein